MYGYAIFCIYLLFTISVKGELNTRMLMNSYGSKICPYTNFCQSKATKILNNETVMPCCLPCSCEANCWKVGNCCPDRDVTDFEHPDLQCKATMVKRIPTDTLVYHGYTDGIERYRIKDRCIPSENNETLIKLCEGENRTTIEQYTWVSQKSRGKIFQNRYCALCNNVSDFVVWQIRTKYSPVLLANASNLPRTILLDECDLIIDVPEHQLKLAETYRCFVPTISKCNVSGLWDHFDEDIERGCETFDSPIFVPLVRRTDIYKNIYCYICNTNTNKAAQTVCTNWRLDSKWTNNAFSALIDFEKFQYDGDKIRNTECRVGEIYDQFTKQCRKLICPFGDVAYNGKCENVAFQTLGLTVQIQYNIKVLQHVSHICKADFETLDKEIFGKAMKTKFVKNFGFRKGVCPVCGYNIKMVASSQQASQQDLTTEFILTTKMYTDFDCQLDSIYSLATEVFGKEMEIDLGDCLRFRMIYRLNKQTSKALSQLPFTTIYHDMKRCQGMYLLNREKICPEVKIAASELMSWIGKNNKTNIHTLSQIEDDDFDNNTVTLCWEDYVSVMSQIPFSTSSSSTLSLTPDQILKTILLIAVYYTI